MAFVQFKAIPSLDDIKELFKATTGCVFQVEMSWTRWITVDPDDVLCFQPYIRPCHMAILLETANGDRNACALLRQLLRPHGFGIVRQQGKEIWSLLELKENAKLVGKKAGTVIQWSDDQ
jgi:hypothetical protein